MPKNSRSGRVYIYVLGVLFLLLASWCAADWYSAFPPEAPRNYVGRQTCAKCHESQMKSWHGSDHDRAMELASEASVLGDFNEAEFSRLGATTRFFRRDNKYMVNAEGPDGDLHDYEIKYTFGVRPLQQYMVEFPDGRVQVLRESWDSVKGEWFYVSPPDVTDEILKPDDPLHWTSIAQNWNTMCADCHSTNLQKNYDLATNTYHTTFSEIDVSCETCHGPASMHVELAESGSLFWDRHHGYGLSKLKGGSAERQIETCAPCHSRRTAIHENFHAGERFADSYEPSLLREGLYHADGQILDEVYVYGSFLQSKMHSKGVRCTDCHNPHSLKLKFEGNRLCTQCHQPGKYDSPTHHHHTDPAGSQCVSCHMPSRTYMGIDDRRDHSLRVPRPDLTVKLGTPNACNDCHDKPAETPAWAAERIREWYPNSRSDNPHFANAIAAARQGEAEGIDLVRDLLRRQAEPDIVRATALDLLARYSSASSDRVCREAINDTNPLVRAAAIRALSPQAINQFAGEIGDLLNDPVRLVRLAAVRRLAESGTQLAGVDLREAFEREVIEYREAHALTLDRAGSHMNLAALSLALGETDAAQESLRNAIRLEPYLSGTRDQLAQMMERSGGNEEQIRQLREKEIELLERDSHLLPDSPQPRYRRGMLLYLLERHDEARQSFEQACEVAPNSYESWMALALLCENQQRWEQAIEALGQMERLQPGDRSISDIFRRIQQARDK